MAGFLSKAIVTIAALSVGCGLKAQSPSGPQPKTSIENPPVEDVEQRLGPFSLRSENFTVALHEKRLLAHV